MKILAQLWTTVVTVTQWFTLSPFSNSDSHQQAIGIHPHFESEVTDVAPSPPRFLPPGSNIDGFRCDYSAMGPDWSSCTDIPGCWLKHKDGKQFFNTSTDYEAVAPVGVTRNYTLYVTDAVVNADGLNFTEAKVFNNSFPGPLLEACWGDTLNITVINNLQFNGTSVHWHGIRQNQTTPMDGVNGITQCPIAPGDHFNYRWKAVQYGSSWYHSHYSVQYADGTQGPITIHGPTTAHYDEAITPLITTDWLHNSAFEAQTTKQANVTVLLDGRGNFTRVHNETADNPIPKPFEMTFSPAPSNPKTGAKRYLLRVINTSYATQITFSIDNHLLQVVETDFVPVLPSEPLTSVMVAIGQRYHLIVEAKPHYGQENPQPASQNFWIRTQGSGCLDDLDSAFSNNSVIPGWERTGILRYTGAPTDQDPTSLPWPNIPQNCDDTLSTLLEPAFKWNVTQAANGLEVFVATFNPGPSQYGLGKFALQPQKNPVFTPFQTTYGNPTFLNLDNTGGDWPVGWVVIPENYTSTDFVYFVLEQGGHPIHLHGHDFAVLDYQADKVFDPSTLKPFYSNPARRDVILLPPSNGTATGYAVIAFKTDNPGTWLMHCHIALHASAGLSLQIMERQSAANQLWPPGNSPALSEARRVCANWNSWAYDCKNYWPGKDANGTFPSCQDDTILQNDSGI